jgi:hypothetical protein
MVAYSYALAGILAPNVFWSPRILAGVFAALATGLLGWIARREFGPGVAMPAMWMMTPMIILPGVDQFIANTEMFMLLPLMATVAVYIGSRGSKSGPAHWLAAGLLSGITICYKYTSFPLLAFVVVVWSFEEWHSGKSARAIVGRWLAALAGAAAGTAMVLAPFLLHDGGKRLWECTVVFNRFYVASGAMGMAGLWLVLGKLLRCWWILFLAPCLLVFRPGRRVWFWGALLLVAWLGSAGSPFGHYYIAIMPFWALLAAVGLRSFAGWASAKAPISRGAISLALTSVVMVVICASDVHLLLLNRTQFAVERMGLASPFIEAPLVSARLAQITTAHDFVYVGGSEPEILCYAHRFGATRFDIAAPLMLSTPLAKGYQTEAMRVLQEHPPKAVVFVQWESSWAADPGSPPGFMDFLRKFVSENYEIVGGSFSEGNQSHWREPLSQADMNLCHILLFKRKVP